MQYEYLFWSMAAVVAAAAGWRRAVRPAGIGQTDLDRGRRAGGGDFRRGAGVVAPEWIRGSGGDAVHRRLHVRTGDRRRVSLLTRRILLRRAER